MDLSFPDHLLKSSLLVPITRTLPEKRPSNFDLVLPSSSDLVLSSSSNELARSSNNPPNGSVQPSSQRLRRIQLELEKERELYSMHTAAASKSFERISSLVGELSGFIGTRETSYETPQVPPKKAQVVKLPALESTNHTETVMDTSVTIKSSYFSRKPRSLLFPGNLHDDLMISTSLDGSIQYNSISKQSIIRSVFIQLYMKRPCFVECICQAEPLNGFIFSTADSGSTQGEVTNSSSSVMFLPNSLDSEPVPTLFMAGDGSPHQKEISALCTFYEGGLESRFRFLSGGLDRNVVLWELDRESDVVSTNGLYRAHTSAVHSIIQTRDSPELIWSGGADCRLLAWSTKESTMAHSYLFDFRISHLLSNPHHPSNILMTFVNRNQQLQLLDTRSPLQQNSWIFGHKELKMTSRYMRPGWSADGNFVAFGTAVPESGVSAINVWDIRYLKHDNSPAKSIEFTKVRRFLCSEFGPSGSLIVATTTDGSACFVDFTTGKDPLSTGGDTH